MLKRINLQLFGKEEPNNTQQTNAEEGANVENQGGNNTEGNTGSTDNAEEGEKGTSSQEQSGSGTESRSQQPQNQPTKAPEQSGKDDLETLLMRAQLSAYKEGKFNPKAVEDAVVLAVHEARAKGEVTEESIKTALDNVLQRNPEWAKKAEAEGGTGFRVGADGTEGASSIENDVFIPKKSWNRHK